MDDEKGMAFGHRSQPGRDITKRMDSTQDHERTIKIPPAPLCKGGLGGFQRIFSKLDFLSKILRFCTLAVQGAMMNRAKFLFSPSRKKMMLHSQKV
jgi:hypothetical protein